MKILFKRKSNTFSIEPNKLTNYLQIENSINNIFFPRMIFLYQVVSKYSTISWLTLFLRISEGFGSLLNHYRGNTPQQKYFQSGLVRWDMLDMLAEFGVFSWQLSHTTLSAQYSLSE